MILAVRPQGSKEKPTMIILPLFLEYLKSEDFLPMETYHTKLNKLSGNITIFLNAVLVTIISTYQTFF